MSGFGAAARARFHLLRRSPGTRWALLATLTVAAGRVGIGKLIEISGWVGRAQLDRPGAPAPSAPLPANGHGPFADGLLAGIKIAFVILLVLAAHGQARERELGTVRLSLVRRASRSAILLADFAILHLLGAILVAAAILAALGASALLYRFGPIVEDGFQIFSSGEVLAEDFRGLGLALLCLPPLVALGLLASVACRSAAGAVAAALLGAMAFGLLQGLLGDGAGLVFLDHVPAIIDRSALGEAAKLARGFSDAGFGAARTLRNLMVPLPEGALLLGLGLSIQARRRM